MDDKDIVVEQLGKDVTRSAEKLPESPLGGGLGDPARRFWHISKGYFMLPRQTGE
jgi:hypothetical protein